MAGHCVSKQVGLPTARFPLAGSLLLGRRARRARFPTCGVVHVAGYSVVWDCDPTPILPLKSTKRSATTILGRSAPSLLFHGALRNILLPTGFPATIHMIELEQTFANDSLQKISLAAAASESNRFYPVFLPHNMVLPVLVLPQIFKMDGEWPSISAGEMLSLAMSIYYFVKFRNMWRASNPSETDAAEKPS